MYSSASSKQGTNSTRYQMTSCQPHNDARSRSPLLDEDVQADLVVKKTLDWESPTAKTPGKTTLHTLKIARASRHAGRYLSIGAGACGVVFRELRTAHAIKVAKATDGQLWNDYVFHTLVVESFAASPFGASEELSIPKCLWFVSHDDKKWWNVHRSRFKRDSGVDAPRDVLCTERIEPLPEELRHAIIDRWCPEHLKYGAKVDYKNRSCLVRVYLGRHRIPRSRPQTAFSLRNFNLFVDMIQELDIAEFGGVAKTMGRALALLHWSVGTDARDVEFVLGSAPTPVDSPIPGPQLLRVEPQSTWEQVTKQHNSRRRAIRLWLLDFNQCRPIGRDEAGVAVAVQAFYTNDPYFPRPYSATSSAKELWELFRTGYEQAGAWALRGASDGEKGLARKFIAEVVTEQHVRMKRQAEAAARVAANTYVDGG